MADPKPARRRSNDPYGLRRKVLDAAASLFQSRGYATTTMQDIVARAETTAGALHHHFPTKKAIGLAVLRERVGPTVEETWLAPVTAARSTSEGVGLVFRSIQEELDARQAVNGCPLNNLALELSVADPEFRKEIQRIFGRWREALAVKLRSDKAAGRVGKIDPEAFATFIIATYSGAMAIAKAEQGTAALKICRKQILRELRA